MTKIKLVTILSALIMVVSTAGCSANDDLILDDTIPGVSESDDSTSSSGSMNDEDGNDDDPSFDYDESYNGYYNFTLAFAFTDSDGNSTSIPDNATAYIFGGWDNWASYTPLTYLDGTYNITFDKIEIGTYRYKVVMWFSDESVSWLNCVEITDGNQILRIRTDYSYNYTLNINLELNVSLPSEEEKENKLNAFSSTLKILNVAASIGCLSKLWEAIHIEAQSPNDKTSFNISMNPDNERFGEYWGEYNYDRYFVYGVSSYDNYKDDSIDYFYYVDGLAYDYFVPHSGTRSSVATVDFITYLSYFTIEDLIGDYSIPFSDAEELIRLVNTGVDSDGNAIYYSLTTEGNEYTLVVNSEAKGIYTYKCTSDLEFTYVSYDDEDGYTFEVEPTTISEIDTKIDLLRSSFTLCIEPEDVFKRIYTNCNYTVQYEFEEMITDDYVTYGEYEAASSSERNQIIYNLELNFQLIEDNVYICYTEDALFIRFGYIGDDGIQTAPSPQSPQFLLPIFISDYGILLVNGTTLEGNDCLYVYFSGDYGETWELGSFTDANGVTHASDQSVYEGHWQDYCPNLSDCYGTLTQDVLYYYGMQPRYTAIGGYTVWLYEDYDASSLVFKSLGGQFLFGDYYNEYISTFIEPYLLCFDPRYQIMEASYDYEGFFPDDEDFLEDGWEISDDTHLYVHYLEVIATIENIGKVDLNNILSNWVY